jgi:GT2 family glycosyltransferase
VSGAPTQSSGEHGTGASWPENGPAVSIVVVAFRQEEALAESLDSCIAAAAALPAKAELIVVDNGRLTERVVGRWPTALVLSPGRNLGFAGAVNLALARARGRWIALVNDDARIERDALARMLERGEGDPRTGAVAAQVRFAADPYRVNSAGIEVDSIGVASERLAGRPVGEAAEPCEVFGASGAVALLRRQMLDDLGGMAACFFAYLEDVDLAWRARAAGWKAVYEPGAIAYHRASASTGEGAALKYRLAGRNRVWLLARNATMRQLVRALPAIVLYDTAYVLYAAMTDRTLAPLQGRLRGLRGWRAARRRGGAWRREVPLGSAWRGWLDALSMHRAYRAHAMSPAEPTGAEPTPAEPTGAEPTP